MPDQTQTAVASLGTNTMPWGTLRVAELNHDLPIKLLVDDPEPPTA